MDSSQSGKFHSKHLFRMSKIKKRGKNKIKPAYSSKKCKTRTPTFKTMPVTQGYSIRKASSNSQPSSEESQVSTLKSSRLVAVPDNQEINPNLWQTERSCHQSQATSSSTFYQPPPRNRAVRPREETESSDDSEAEDETNSEFQGFYRTSNMDKKMLEQSVQAQYGDSLEGLSNVFTLQSDQDVGSEDVFSDEEMSPNQQFRRNSQSPERMSDNEEEEEDEQPSNENEFQIVQDRNFHVLILGRKAEVALVGAAMIKVLSGQAQILGYTLNPSAKNFIPVYSLRYQSHLTIRALPTSNITKKQMNENLIQKLENELVSGRVIKYITETTDKNSTVVLLKPVSSKVSVKFAFHLSRLNLNSSDYGLWGKSVKINNLAYNKLVSPNYSLVPAHQVHTLKLDNIDSILQDIDDNLSYSITHGTHPPRVLLCGPKNAGKSTIIRYLINHILPSCDKVVYLDADPGQSEFTSSGSISLTAVESPLLGQPFTHQKTPEATVYVGGKDVSNTPDTYSTGISDLMVHYQSVFNDAPLFINTMGWTSLTGVNLLMDVMRFVEPTFVIQINLDNAASQNLPNLSASFVNQESGWKTNPGEFNLGYEHRVLTLTADQFPHIRHNTGDSNKLFRELALYAYFGRLQGKVSVDNYDPINSFKPYKIPFKSIGVYFCNETPPMEFTLDALNVSLVALCLIDIEQMSRDPEFPHYPKRVHSIEGNVQLGYGIIRGINHKEETILVITPEPLSRLQSVNALVLGLDGIPTKFLTSAKVQGYIPYVSKRNNQKNSALSKKIKRKMAKSAVKTQEWVSPNMIPISQ